MKVIINKIEVLIFGDKVKITNTFHPGTRTVFPTEILDEEEWFKEYKVSFMHGWRSNPVYLDK